MKRYVFGALLFLIFLSTNAFAQQFNVIPPDALDTLEKPETLELLSLDPELNTSAGFHGWWVVGKTTVTGSTKDAIVEALKKSVRTSDGSRAKCFTPRHGIRVHYEEQTIDLVICFECSNALVYGDRAGEKSFSLTSVAQPVFDKILREAKLELFVE